MVSILPSPLFEDALDVLGQVTHDPLEAVESPLKSATIRLGIAAPTIANGLVCVFAELVFRRVNSHSFIFFLLVREGLSRGLFTPGRIYSHDCRPGFGPDRQIGTSDASSSPYAPPAFS